MTSTVVGDLPDLTGQRVASVDFEFALNIVTEEGWYLTVEAELPAATVDAVRDRVGDTITAFAISPAGVLAFEVGGVGVRAAPDVMYEAWNVVGPDQQRVVCMPGGELAIWS